MPQTNLDKMGNLASIVVAICVLVVTVSMVAGGRARASKTLSSRARPDSIRISNWETYLVGGHARGPANAKVTVLEFGDYECPFCAKFAATIDRLLQLYPADIRFVYRHWPLTFHRFAYPAARAAECAAAQGKFWEFHDVLYAKQDSLGLLSFIEVARRVAIPDTSRFEDCVASQTNVPAIETAMRDVEAIGGTGTPTIIVNGILLRTALLDSAYVASILSASK